MIKRILSAVLSIAMAVAVIQLDGAYFYAQYNEVKDSIINSVLNVRNTLATNDECDHDYVYYKSTGKPTCETSGYITYVCTKCDNTKQERTSLGHKYKAYGVEYRAINYKCEYCNKTTTVKVENAMALFDENLNKKPARKNDNCYADIVADDVINAKDYAYLKKLSKHSLSNPNADEKTQRVYDYLCNMYGKKVLSAQQESTWMGSPDYEMNYIKNNTGKYPAMRGLDYMNDDFNGVNSRAIEWWNKGGLVTICWHTGSDFCGEWNDAKNDNVENWNAMLTPGTDEYKQMIDGMDKAAIALKKLQDAGVTVLWRPFHEFDGGWFWWGKNGAESFKQLWKIMYDRYTNYWGLNNLIWVLGYCHNGEQYGENVSLWNPGYQYYDIIGADSYDEPEYTTLYHLMRSIAANGKPVVMHECGTNPTADRLATETWGYFMTWHTEYLTTSDYNTKQALKELYNSDIVITLDEVSY